MTTALHTLAHAWNDIENFGPWYVFWTLPRERYMKYMRANIFSGAYPAANFITRAKRIQRLAHISPRVCRLLTLKFRTSGYQPSDALAAALGQRSKNIGWLGVRGFKKIKSPQVTFDILALFQSVSMKDHPVFAPAFANAKTQARTEVDAELDGLRQGAERNRYRKTRAADIAARHLRRHVAVKFGQSLSYKRRYYGSEYTEGAATPGTACASWVWVPGDSLNANYSGMWHGRIIYFVQVASGQTTLHFAAIRIFDATRIRSDPDYGFSIVSVDADADDLGLHPRFYFVEVPTIGGRTALCSRDKDPRWWIVYIDYDPDED